MAPWSFIGTQTPATIKPARKTVLQGAGTREAMELHDGGAQAYPRMLEAIANAARYVRLQVYAFALDSVGQQFVAALSGAAARGVSVNVAVDGWGSRRHGAKLARTLRAVGCQVRIHNRLRVMFSGRVGRNHRKLLLIDDEVAFVGGLNIGDENVERTEHVAWADLVLEIRGEPCRRLGQMLRRERPTPHRSSVRIYLSGLGGGRRLRHQYIRAFACARNRILLAHGYFLPDRRIVRAITAASKRGVTVSLLLSGETDVPFARIAQRSLYRTLLGAGVEIREWKRSVLHAKLATVDDSHLLIGSFNLDPFSLVNLESMVEVSDSSIVADGERWIRERLALAPPVGPMTSQSRRHRWLLEPLGRLVARGAALVARILRGRRRRRRRRR